MIFSTQTRLPRLRLDTNSGDYAMFSSFGGCSYRKNEPVVHSLVSLPGTTPVSARNLSNSETVKDVSYRRRFQMMRAQLKVSDRSTFCPPAVELSGPSQSIVPFAPPRRRVQGKVEVGRPSTSRSSTKGSFPLSARPETFARISADKDGPARLNLRRTEEGRILRENNTLTAAFHLPSQPCQSGRDVFARRTKDSSAVHAYSAPSVWPTTRTFHRQVAMPQLPQARETAPATSELRG